MVSIASEWEDFEHDKSLIVLVILGIIYFNMQHLWIKAIKPGFEFWLHFKIAVWPLGKFLMLVSVSLSVKRIGMTIKCANTHKGLRALPGS